MNNSGNFKVKVAAPSKRKQNLDKKVVASHDFGTMLPIECKVMFPGDHFKVKVDQFTRLMPMPSPTFGKIDTITRAFFVPFRILFKDWKEFISNQQVAKAAGDHISASAAVCPATTIGYFSNAFYLLCSHDADPVGGQLGRIDFAETPANYDFVFIAGSNNDGVKKGYLTLTYMGRKFLDVFFGLGYNIPFCMYAGTDEENLEAIFKKKISLLPLLSFAKMYFDWVIPSRFISQHRQIQVALDAIYQGHTNLNSSGSYNDGSGIVKPALLFGLMKLYSSYLSDDFFTSAFVSPFGYEDSNVGVGTNIPNPNNPADSSFLSVKDYGQNGAGAGGREETFFAGAYNEGDSILQQFTLKSLGALQDMVNRGKVAGNKIQDYLRVTYGIRPSAEALDLSVYLSSHRSSIKIGDVMSNADTANQGGAYLGEYAGRGLGQNFGEFEYEAKEHGIFIITNELTVKSSYWQGLRPECELIDRLDFFQPEFDNLGVDAISQAQLRFVDLDGSDPTGIDSDAVFGFTPRYSKYKYNFDSLLGDFRFKTKNKGLDSWYLARYFEIPEEIEDLYIDENFSLMTQRNAATQYDHIFQVSDNSADHFYSVFNLNFIAERNMISPSDALDTEEGTRTEEVKFNGGLES